MSNPFFSVVIPTKNRIEPLRFTLKSILQQEFTDWECVIVDNNDDEKLLPFLAEISDPRIRRVKTGGLHMAGNWEAALQAGIGEYIVLINDKQCLYGHALLVAHEKLKGGEYELLAWSGNVLNDLDSENLTAGNPKGDRKFRVLFSDDALAECTFATKRSRRKFTQFPKGFIVCCQSVVRRSTLEAIRLRTGQAICHPVSPDVTMGCQLLNHLDSYLYFDGEMSFCHSMSVSSGGNMLRHKKDVNNIFSIMGGEEITYRHIPIKYMITECHHYNDYIFMRNLIGGRLARYPLPWVMFYVLVHEHLAKSLREGMDRTPEMQAWEKALSAEPWWTQLKVRAYLSSIDFRAFGRNLRVWLGLRRLETVFRRRKKSSAAPPGRIPSPSSFLAERTHLFRAIDCR